jgi:hypothetical protein
MVSPSNYGADHDDDDLNDLRTKLARTLRPGIFISRKPKPERLPSGSLPLAQRSRVPRSVELGQLGCGRLRRRFIINASICFSFSS